MIRSNFKIVFKIDVYHSYFEQSICNCLQFTPGVATGELLKRFDFKIRSKINGFDFYINPPKELTAFLKYITETTGQTYFDFSIDTNNPKFKYFTEMPINQCGQLLYDSHADINSYDQNTVRLNESFSQARGKSNLGSLIVRFEDIIKLQVDNNYVQFCINYKARSTQWQYYFINKSSVQLSNPAVTSKTGVYFSNPSNVVIESGQQAILFSSGSNLIPLSQVPKHKFDLVNNPIITGTETSKQSAAVKTIFKGLPTPDPVRIGLNGNNEDLLSSPMYVYI